MSIDLLVGKAWQKRSVLTGEFYKHAWRKHFHVRACERCGNDLKGQRKSDDTF